MIYQRVYSLVNVFVSSYIYGMGRSRNWNSLVDKMGLGLTKFQGDEGSNETEESLSLWDKAKNVYNWRENLSENITPYGYEEDEWDTLEQTWQKRSPLERLYDGIVLDKKEKSRSEFEKRGGYTHLNYNPPLTPDQIAAGEVHKGFGGGPLTNPEHRERMDLLNMLVGRDQIYNTIHPSLSKPTKEEMVIYNLLAEDSDVTYYSSPTTEKNLRNYMSDGSVSVDEIIEGALYGDVLGNYTLDKGEDEKGSYLSYYDKWDVNPLSDKTEGRGADYMSSWLENAIQSVAGLTPAEMYGRVHYDPETNIPIENKQVGGSLPKAQDGFALNQTSANPFIYGDWAEVSRNVNPDTGATTIIDERTGNRDVAYSKRGVNWKVGYENWLAAGNKGSLADFKIEAERWKKSQTENESDIQNRERTLPGDEASITEDFYGLEIGDSTEPTVLNGSDEPGGSTEGFYGDFGVQGNRELQGNAGVQGNTGTTTGNTTIRPLLPRPISLIDQPEISFSQRYPGGSISPRGEVLRDSYVDSNSSYEVNSRIKNNGKEKLKETLLEDTTVTDSDGYTNMNVKSVDNGNREKFKQVFNIYDTEDNLLVRDVEKTNAFGNVVNRNHTTREGELAGYGIKRNGGSLPKAQDGNRETTRQDSLDIYNKSEAHLQGYLDDDYEIISNEPLEKTRTKYTWIDKEIPDLPDEVWAELKGLWSTFYHKATNRQPGSDTWTNEEYSAFWKKRDGLLETFNNRANAIQEEYGLEDPPGFEAIRKREPTTWNGDERIEGKTTVIDYKPAPATKEGIPQTFNIGTRHSPFGDSTVQDIDEYRYLQGDLQNNVVNPDMPMGYYDRRIEPMNSIQLKKMVPDSTGAMVPDYVTLNSYNSLDKALGLPIDPNQMFSSLGTNNVLTNGLQHAAPVLADFTNSIEPLEPRGIPTIDIERPEGLMESTTTIPTSGRKSTYGYTAKGGRYGQVPTHRNVWNDETKKWMRVNLEPEEIEYYKKQNLPKKKQNIKASFKTGGALPKAQVGYEAVADPEVGAQLASPTMTEEEYYNPEIRDITSGDWRQDFLYKNPWLMDTPIFGDMIKNIAHNVASQHSGATRRPKEIDLFERGELRTDGNKDKERKIGTPEGYAINEGPLSKKSPWLRNNEYVGDYDGEGRTPLKLLDIYFQEEDERDLAQSIYTPTDDYYEWLPSYSLKGNLDEYFYKTEFDQSQGLNRSNFDDITTIIEGLLSDDNTTWEEFKTNKKTIFDNSDGRESSASRLLNANLAHHKQGLAWDDELQLPYMSISDAWDFEPGDYANRWARKGSGDESWRADGRSLDQTYIQSSIMHRAGNPFKIYDRFYIDPETKYYITDKEIAKRRELINK